MTPEDLQELTHRLVDAHELAKKRLRRRPRKAAKDLCREFRTLVGRQDYWTELADQSERLARHREEADQILQDIKQLVLLENEILGRIGIDEATAGTTIADVVDAVDLVAARNADIGPQSVRNLQDRLRTTTELICNMSRGPILRGVDFVVSKKGAKALGACGLGAANLWFAITADGGAVSSASIKVANSIADIQLGAIPDFLG